MPAQIVAFKARDVFASNLRRIRVAQGLSQEQLAERAKLHRTFVGCVERSEKSISIDNMEGIAVALGVDLRDLLSPEGE